jgi:hypothetical protein
MAYSLFDLLLHLFLFLYSLNSLFLLTSLFLIFMINNKNTTYHKNPSFIYIPLLGYSQIPILPLIPLLIPLINLHFTITTNSCTIYTIATTLSPRHSILFKIITKVSLLSLHNPLTHTRLLYYP